MICIVERELGRGLCTELLYVIILPCFPTFCRLLLVPCLWAFEDTATVQTSRPLRGALEA